ncbi:MAG: hypothetical protein KKH98_09945 [Spirochaetes bacterium]|nr:hypothetical protein [Spirochaetota bacterium]
MKLLLKIKSKHFMIRLLNITCFLLLFAGISRATILYDFETDNSGWTNDSWGFSGPPPQHSTTVSYIGTGSIKYTNTMTHDWSGAGKKYHGDPGLDLSGYSNISMRIRVPDTIIPGVTYMVLQVFTRSGGAANNWTNNWGPEFQGFLTPGTWTNVTMNISDIAHATNVNDIAFQLKHFNTTNFCEVHIDLVEALGTNSVPENITSFTASSTGVGIKLNWKNPNNSDYASTMIRYSTNQYPANQSDGQLLCIKAGSPAQTGSTNHINLVSGKIYYYSAFAVNSQGKYSSTNSSSKAEVTFLSLSNIQYQVERFSRAEQEIVRYGNNNVVAYNAMKLYWDSPGADPDFIDYTLYRSTEPLTMNNIQNGSAANLVSFSISDGSVTSYLDTTVPSFETRYYYVLLSDYGSALRSFSGNIATLTYEPDDYLGWVYKNVKPNYIWKEAEDYSSKSAIDRAEYSTASAGSFMEHFEDDSSGGFVSYDVTIPEDMMNASIYLRHSAAGDTPYLNVYIDGQKKVDGWAIEPKGSDWYAFSFQDIKIGDGILSKGNHTLNITTTSGNTINVDGFFIYDNLYGGFTPDNTLMNGTVPMPPDVQINVRNISINYDLLSTVLADPYYSAAAANPLIANPKALTAYKLELEGKPDILFNKLVDLSMDYSEADIPAGKQEEELMVFYWMGEDWHRMGGNLDKEANLVNIQVNHLGIYALYAATPFNIEFKWSYNPFAPNGQGNYQKTSMSFYLAKAATIRVKLFNLSGRLIRTLLEQELTPGPVSVEWDGKDDNGKNVPIGVYIYQVEGADDNVHNGTITVLR